MLPAFRLFLVVFSGACMGVFHMWVTREDPQREDRLTLASLGTNRGVRGCSPMSTRTRPPKTSGLPSLCEVESFFSTIMKTEPDTSAGIAAIRTLLNYLEHDRSDTVQELVVNIHRAIGIMRSTDYPTISVVSGSELFLRFITLTPSLDSSPFAECRKEMIQRGKVFLRKLTEARGKIAKPAADFITDGSRVLTHSKSRVVLDAMKEAKKTERRFEVYVTTCSIDDSGREMFRELRSLNIPCTLILDSAVAYVMEKIDMVMVGAEGVVESGGIVNKLGTLTMAICARQMYKPFYVLTESFKFARMFPLNQRDLPREFKYPASYLGVNQNDLAEEFKYPKSHLDLEPMHPLVDYTPPGFVTLLFTDLGILTPSAVSDELIKLYL